ncbi:F0F1 ATP synthase subunit B [Bacteroides reticulotermitis]|uniref:ATP synthase subunit b n=2 Tax=Bacteroides reticulotermitis TaxID=1133319 RepID=W4URN1_9BACE|nr:F0F1 ATP synthase subunit B [Bacteroides reticulotermitis]MBB4043908.1 F-type H+-transporting ATPase subunit b [Bacteroides reticulotermitis]GAE83422.1 ATP synthase B chain [Bacteroides reticulotermitis JCM 10512]
MGLLLPESGLLFWMVLTFGVVFIVLAKYGFPIIVKMVEDRKAYINQSLEVAKEANVQLSRLKEEGEALVIAANKEQGRILKEAMQERDKIVQEARKKAEISAQKELDAVKQQIQIEKEEAIRDIRRQVALLSVDIAEKVLRSNLSNKDAQMGMIDRMLDEVLTKNRN